MNDSGIVEEVPGYYGPVKMEESIIQRIWAEQDLFTDSLQTECGKEIFVHYEGNWNQSEEGPDFKNARLIVDGKEVEGDLEIHFKPKDWKRHGHHLDPRYENVILQICLFPENSGKTEPFHTEKGRELPCLLLVPHLFHGVEEYAEAYTLARLSSRDGKAEKEMNCLIRLSADEREELARIRWLNKLSFARTRLAAQGWEMACHQWFLEILGYRRNKSPMARLAQRFSIEQWKSGVIEPEMAYQSERGWKLRACRPANHPLSRLQQYAELWRISPNWPERLAAFADNNDELIQATNPAKNKPTMLSRIWREQILGDVFAQGKANTLWIDAGWPLLCEFKNLDGFPLWNQWPAGDCPSKFKDWARRLRWTDGSGKKPFSNGQVQCILESLQRRMIKNSENLSWL